MRTAVKIATYIVFIIYIYCNVRMRGLDNEELKYEQVISDIAFLTLMYLGGFLSY